MKALDIIVAPGEISLHRRTLHTPPRRTIRTTGGSVCIRYDAACPSGDGT